ncbi:hypothetical protein IWQ57_000948 [Coemansia nantahalensis]|uniref:Uncharacterized protein n=1 Tax=Coemansia nantahalensis TaxID=2789366 RepID=A0ACC1K6D8_9FUNG|nr:hypothetical protein IWQ57_000948 [Coemansia nantahalensis]
MCDALADSDKERLRGYLNHKLQILCDDGRTFTGIFKCVDAQENFILADTTEVRDDQARKVGMTMVPGKHIKRVLVENLESDMATVSLTMTEKQKSHILAGLHPSAVVDICGRALSFWSFQLSLEITYEQESAAAQAEKTRAVEAHAAAEVASTSARLRLVEDKLAAAQHAVDAERQSRAMAEDMLDDCRRRMQSLKAAYDQLCQRRVLPEADVDFANSEFIGAASWAARDR